jgi:hypothetical protein
VNLWEEPGWDGLAANLARETAGPAMQDPSLAAWWAEAAKYRRGGLDRILVPAPWTRTIEELCRDGVRCGVFTAHELVQVAPGRTREFLEARASASTPTRRSDSSCSAPSAPRCARRGVRALWKIPRAPTGRPSSARRTATASRAGATPGAACRAGSAPCSSTRRSRRCPGEQPQSRTAALEEIG